MLRICSVALALLLPLMSTAQSPERSVDSLMSAYARPGRPGASVLVVRDGHVVLSKSYGLAEVETNRRVTPTTDFRLASLSKQFTATTAMRLITDGRLHYSDPLGALIDGLPDYARTVTVRQLLTHTSGLPDYEDFVPDSQTRQVHDAEIPALITHGTPMFAPGTRYHYSNTGYVLLALAIERVTGQRFADVLRDELFTSLGMTHTVAFEDGRATVPERAFGYAVDSTGHVRRTDQSNTSATLGDGGIYTSIADLARWDDAMNRNALVSADLQRLAWTPPKLPNDAPTSYGFGWFVEHDERGALRVWHNGESRGFTNGVVRYPDERLGVWVLTNRTGGTPWEIAKQIAALYR